MKKLFASLIMVFMLTALFVAMPAKAEQRIEKGKYKSLYAADWRSGSVICAENETEHLPIASMCKIMMLVLCFEAVDSGNLNLDEEIQVSETASGMGGSQVFLEAGASYKASDLIESICIASANDSCVAMAERLAGGEEPFVRKMNEKAASLGMDDTVFVNCTGLPESGQYSCAKDVSVMLSELMRHEDYFRYSKIWMDKITHPKGRETEMANTNKMIRSYNGCDAGKTGFTNEAGYCLAASAMRGNMRIVCVVIGAQDSKTRFETVKQTFDYSFANYTNKVIIDGDTPFEERCAVKGGKQSSIAVRAERSSYVFCSRNDSDEIFYEAEFKKVSAPVKEGDVVGTVTVYKNNVQADKINLLANESVKKCSYLDSLRDLAENWNF